MARRLGGDIEGLGGETLCFHHHHHTHYHHDHHHHIHHLNDHHHQVHNRHNHYVARRLEGDIEGLGGSLA